MEKLYEQYELTATGWASSPDPAIFAQALHEIHKFATTGAPREVLQMSNRLLDKKDNPKLKECGLNLLLHLVSRRWADLSNQNKQTIFSAVPRLIASAAKEIAWTFKNKTAMVVSHLVVEEGSGSWAKLVSASTDYLSCDEIMAEKSIITCLSEAITIPNDGSKVDKTTRALKIQNWDWLPETLFPLLLKHLANSDTTKVAAAQQHYDLALCIANTATAYAQWAEVKNLVKGTDWIERVQPGDYDHGVLMDIFHMFFDILATPLDPSHVMFGARETVCLSLVSVKQALGPDFEPLREGVVCSLEKLKADGLITVKEYEQLREKLCD